MSIQTICVCGAGTMGSGIAQVAAQSGFNTILYEVQEPLLHKSRLQIAGSLKQLVERGKMNADAAGDVLPRIHFTHSLQDCVADVVIEAIIENQEAKVNLFNRLAAINAPHTILASNTSSLSISALQQHITIPDRVAGMHFFNPAQVMKLVEVVQGNETSPAVVNTLVNLTSQMGKVPVRCKDAPGFIVNHVARPYYLKAMRLVEAGVASIEEVDHILESTGFKMGPFRLMDLIGMDINYRVSEIVWEALGKPDRLKPAALQKAKLDCGELGRKTGQGFYTYNVSE